MKITGKQLKKLIREFADEYIDDINGGTGNARITDYMSNMGDTKMTPEVHVFWYRGQPTDSMVSSVKGIIDELEQGGAPIKKDKNEIAKEILNSIRKAVTEESL